jgi:hypothetical protein
LLPSQLAVLVDDPLEDRSEEASLARWVALRDEVDREDGEVGSAANGQVGSVLVGDDNPREPELVHEKLPERATEHLDHRLGVLLDSVHHDVPEPIEPLGPEGRCSILGEDVDSGLDQPLLLFVFQRNDLLVQLGDGGTEPTAETHG